MFSPIPLLSFSPEVFLFPLFSLSGASSFIFRKNPSLTLQEYVSLCVGGNWSGAGGKKGDRKKVITSQSRKRLRRRRRFLKALRPRIALVIHFSGSSEANGCHSVCTFRIVKHSERPPRGWFSCDELSPSKWGIFNPPSRPRGARFRGHWVVPTAAVMTSLLRWPEAFFLRSPPSPF